MSSGAKRKRSHKASAAADDGDEKRSKQSKIKGKSAADGQVEFCGSLQFEIRFLSSFDASFRRFRWLTAGNGRDRGIRSRARQGNCGSFNFAYGRVFSQNSASTSDSGSSESKKQKRGKFAAVLGQHAPAQDKIILKARATLLYCIMFLL
jgi:hypothetical protein